MYIVDNESAAFEDAETASYVGKGLYFNRLMAQITGIYPTIILVIVALEQSFLEHAFSDPKLSAFVAARAGQLPASAIDGIAGPIEHFIRSAWIKSEVSAGDTGVKAIVPDIESTRAKRRD